MLKKGDKIKRKDGSPFSNKEYVVTVCEVVGNDVFLKGLGTYTDYSDVEKVTTPRPHAEIIKAMADDNSVEVQRLTSCLDGSPGWAACPMLDLITNPERTYRIKPEKSEVDERIEALEAELMALKEARKAESR